MSIHSMLCLANMSFGQSTCVCNAANRLADAVAIERERERIQKTAEFVTHMPGSMTDKLNAFLKLRGPKVGLTGAAMDAESAVDRGVKTGYKKRDKGRGKDKKAKSADKLEASRVQIAGKLATGLPPFDNERMARRLGITTSQAAGKGGYTTAEEDLNQRRVDDIESWQRDLSPASLRYLERSGQADSVTRAILRKPLPVRAGSDSMVPRGGALGQSAGARSQQRFGPQAQYPYTSRER